MHHSAVRLEEEIRAVAPDRIVESRVLPFTPRLELTGLDKWNRLRQRDPIGTAMIQTAFLKLYALHFPDDAETR